MDRPFRLWAYDDRGVEPSTYVASFETLDAAIVGRTRHAPAHPGRTLRVWEWQRLPGDEWPYCGRWKDHGEPAGGERG